MSHAHKIAFATVALCAAAGIANADTYVMTYNGHGNGRTVRISTNSGGNYSDTFGGEFLWTRTGGTAAAAPAVNASVSTFCIELEQSNPSTGGSGTYDRVVGSALDGGASTSTPMGTQNRIYLSELYARFYGTLVDNDEQMAAFQLCVWECVYDSGLSLTSGSFRAQNTNSSYGIAAGWLAQITGTGPSMTLTAMTSSFKQDHIIPTPGAAALAGLGLLAVGRRRR